MIAQLFSPSTDSTRFSAESLPKAVHGLILETVLTPIVQSESMAPTIQRGDVLELEEALDLTVGDVVVFRHDRFFVCHRIHRIEGERVFLRGDASAGPLDEVDIHNVVGRVRFLSRNGTRLPVPLPIHRPTSRGDLPWIRTVTSRVAYGRSCIRRLIHRIVELPGLKQMVRVVLRKCMTIEILTRASLHAIDGYVSRQRLHLDDIGQGLRDGTSLHDKGMVLLVRLGPIHLGTCRLAPWSIHMRPFLRSQTTDVLIESLEPLRPPHPSSP